LSVSVDIYESYAEVNEELDLPEERQLSADKNVEQYSLIVGARKWFWEGLDEKGPCEGIMGLTLQERVKINDKYDIFIYDR
jgi:hypothetical protein